ncbi:MAG: hypothetical protein II404_01730 [Prevotella sp.]|nr:hypothetical protein [Prevotella sp.]
MRDSEGRVTEQCKSLNNAWPATAEQVINSLKQPYVKATVDKLRQNYDEDVKRWQLPYICPHYSQYRNNHRAQEDILPEAFTHQTCVDVDDPEKAPMAIERALALNQDELSEWKDSVLYVEYSTRKPKCHIWIRMPKGRTIEESQRMFCSDLGEELNVEPDPQCFTPERLILMTGDEVYRSERWLEPLSDEEIEERREAFLMRGLDVDGRPLKKPETIKAVATGNSSQQSGTNVVAANERTRFIVRECLKEAGLTVNDLNEEGGRHNAVKSILSVGITQLMTQGEFLGVMQELSPVYSQEKEYRQLVTDFYAKYTDDSQKLTQFQRRVFAQSRMLSPTKKNHSAKVPDEELPSVVYGDTASLDDIYSSKTPPRLSKSATPRFVKIATGPVPALAKETAAQVMFPPLGMYCDASFTYIDGTPREPRANGLIVAETGGGKDSSTKHMLKHLESPQKEEDKKNRVILDKYKDKCRRMSKNEEQPERPDVSIRSVASDITRARLAELMSDSQGRIIHVRMIEFDQWFGVEGWRPGSDCPFTNLKLADDEDNPFGQERVGSQSITYQGPLSINWNSSTTLTKAVSYFRNNMNDGPISRLTLATVPDQGLGAPIPKHGKYDDKYDAALKPFIDNLRLAHGEVKCQQAIRMTNRLKKELDDFIVTSGDEILNNLARRALAATFRKGCLLYAANGMHWEKAIDGFCRFSLHYDLWLKLHFFADMIRHADSKIKTSHRGPANLLSQIKKDAEGVFTYQDAVNMRIANSKEEEGTSVMLNQWVSRGHIERLTDGRFRIINKDDK